MSHKRMGLVYFSSDSAEKTMVELIFEEDLIRQNIQLPDFC